QPLEQAPALVQDPVLLGQQGPIAKASSFLLRGDGTLLQQPVEQRLDRRFLPPGGRCQRLHQVLRRRLATLPERAHDHAFGFADADGTGHGALGYDCKRRYVYTRQRSCQAPRVANRPCCFAVWKWCVVCGMLGAMEPQDLQPASPPPPPPASSLPRGPGLQPDTPPPPPPAPEHVPPTHGQLVLLLGYL